MKNEKMFFVLIVVFLIFTVTAFSQIYFESHTVIGGELTCEGASSVYTIDLDGDLDIYMLSAFWDNDVGARFENSITISSVSE